MLCLQKAGALRTAALARDKALVEVLLNAGADPNQQNPKVDYDMLIFLHKS